MTKTYKILKPIKPLGRVLPVDMVIELDTDFAVKFADHLEEVFLVDAKSIKLPKKIENATNKKVVNSEKKGTTTSKNNE
jgi:hypothetical protein